MAYRYDVFISYSHKNKRWVNNWLLPRLARAGIRVCIDEKEFRSGAALVSEIRRGVRQSRKAILVLTPAYLKSKYAALEYFMFHHSDPNFRRRRFLPLLLQPCILPPDLASLIYFKFNVPFTRQKEFSRLLRAIRSVP